ncbi:hypothetical protein [Rhizobium sp. BK176]|uniref:hypothetical protein n=1 Tax=Rhizobium sp. BK176 TaxID=2587071 RepID=UPI003863DADD
MFCVLPWQRYPCFHEIVFPHPCLGNEIRCGVFFLTPTPSIQRSKARYATCALKTDGAAWCWGFGTNGQLGNGSSADQSLPVRSTDPPRRQPKKQRLRLLTGAFVFKTKGMTAC